MWGCTVAVVSYRLWLSRFGLWWAGRRRVKEFHGFDRYAITDISILPSKALCVQTVPEFTARLTLSLFPFSLLECLNCRPTYS